MDPRYFTSDPIPFEEIQDDGSRRSRGANDEALYERHIPANSRVLKMASVAAALAFILSTSAVNAAVDLIEVPAMCGTATEILGVLAAKMPNPEAIGKGGDGRGKDIATLFTGNGYWALVALISPDSVCVVASGYTWTVTSPGQAKSY